MTPGYQPFVPRGSLKTFSLYNTHLLWLLESNHLLFPRKHYAKLSKILYKNQFGKMYVMEIMEDYPGKINCISYQAFCYLPATTVLRTDCSFQVITFNLSNTGKTGLPFRPLELLQFSKNCNSSILDFNGLECVNQLFKNTLG